MSTQVYVSVGSNIDPERNVRFALQALEEQFAPLNVSTIYRSAAVGFDGDDFLNLVVGFMTVMEVEELDKLLTRLERDAGRQPGGPKFAARTLDLDLLLYGDLVLDRDGLRLPRPEIRKYAFVLQPLAELAGGMTHPETGETIAAMWEGFSSDEPPLVPVEL